MFVLQLLSNYVGKFNFQNYFFEYDGVAQFVRALNGNDKIASSLPTLGISLMCLWERHVTLLSHLAVVQLSKKERKLATAKLSPTLGWVLK